MAKVAILLGTGTAGEDVLHKIQWLRHFKKEDEVHVISRIGDEHLNTNLKKLYGEKTFNEILNSINELKRISNSFTFVYDHINPKKDYSNEEVIRLQNWLGISFSFISTLDRRFYNKNNLQDSRDKKKLINFVVDLTLLFKTIFLEQQINVFINTIEDDIFSVVAYYVAKRLNINVIGFMWSKFPRKGLMFCEDFKKICQWNSSLDCDIGEIQGLYSDSTIVGKSTMDKTVNYWDIKSSFVSKRIKGVISVGSYHVYVNELIKKYKFEQLIFDPSITLTSQIKKYIKKFLRLCFVKKNITEPNYSDNYFLFPLHFVEDAQMTFREPLIDQFDLIKAVSRVLPLNYYLYVKPHPHFLGTDLSVRKMRELARLDNIKIINPETPSIKLLKNSNVIVTINSTTGFEAMIMGVPVITFGHDFYCKEELCKVVRDFNDLPLNLMDSLTNLNTEISDFVKMVYLNTIWVDTINYEYGFFGLTYNDGKKLALALNKIFERIDREAYN